MAMWHSFIAGMALAPSVAERIKAPEYDASAGGENPVRAPAQAATLCPYM